MRWQRPTEGYRHGNRGLPELAVLPDRLPAQRVHQVGVADQGRLTAGEEGDEEQRVLVGGC
jgi:hypothetical protein